MILLSRSARGRPGKSVQLAESEVRGLCLKSREIFLNQPILLELEAPLKICGKLCYCPLPENGNFKKRKLSKAVISSVAFFLITKVYDFRHCEIVEIA